jgi:hypothetical protein
MDPRRRILAPATLAVVVASLLPIASARAATGSVVRVRPAAAEKSWIVTTQDAGTTRRATALVINLTDRPQDVVIGTADGTTTADGVFTLAGDGERARGVGAWIGLRGGRVRLAPHAERRLPLTIRVPAGTAPGDYSGGVVVRSAAPGPRVAGPGGMSVRVVERVGLRVYVTVAGARDGRVAIDGLRSRTVDSGALRTAAGLKGAVDVGFTVRNRGNVAHPHLTGSVSLVKGGSVRASRPLDLGTLLPGDARPVSVRLGLGGWPAGDYRVVVRMDGAPASEAEEAISVSPLRAYATGVLLLAVGVALVRMRPARAR